MMGSFNRNVGAALLTSGAFFAIMMLSACGETQVESAELDAPVYAAGDTVSVSGILIDTRCLAANWSNIGMDHEDPVPTSHTGEACARFCAREGFPVGLATGTKKDSPVWMLLSTPPLLSDYMAQTVRIRGVVRSEGIITPLRVEAKRPDGGWTFVI